LKDHGVNYKSFTEPYLDSLEPFGDVIVLMLATIASQDSIKISENTKAALAKKKAAGVKLGTPGKNQDQIEQINPPTKGRRHVELCYWQGHGHFGQHCGQICQLVLQHGARGTTQTS
jgi:hypothetical protein